LPTPDPQLHVHRRHIFIMQKTKNEGKRQKMKAGPLRESNSGPLPP
jgi:hypothetical protein